jgi:type IV pilus assembly protein PilB
MARQFTIDQVAELLGTNHRGVVGWIAQGKLTGEKAAEGGFLISESSLTGFMQERGIDLGPLAEAAPEEEPVAVSQAEILPAEQLAQTLIHEAVRRRATHLHIDPVEGGARVSLRIDGFLHPCDGLESDLQGMALPDLLSHIKQSAHFRQDGAEGFGETAEPVDGQPYHIGVRTFPTIAGERLVIELIDLSRQPMELAALGMNDRQTGAVRRALARPYGLVVLVGPPGADRWCVLESLLAEAHLPGRAAAAVEGETALSLPDVVSCRPDRPEMTVAQTLSSLGSQDADVIMVDDATDPAVGLVDEALAGRLVLAGMLAENIARALGMLSGAMEPWRLAAGLSAVVNHRLARKLCPHCKVQAIPDDQALRALCVRAEDLGEGVFEAGGCDACSKTGYLGRTGVFSVMAVSDGVADMIRRGRDMADVWLEAVAEGTQTLLQAGLEKVRAGVISPDELVRALSLVS